MNNSQSLNNFYLWMVGEDEIINSNSELIQERYERISPHIWLDHKPEQLPLIPTNFSPNLTPYFKLFSSNFYIPHIYSIFNIEEKEIILLENAPINSSGELYPSLEEVYSKDSEIRQLYWLWQLWEMWSSLKELNVASSLLISENIRVQGQRIRLRQLYFDQSSPKIPTIADLAKSWTNLVRSAKSPLVLPLTDLTEALQQEDVIVEEIGIKLNHLLLEYASQQPLRMKIAAGTDRGREPTHNEDSYYPTENDLPSEHNEIVSVLSSKLMIVCDGIEGHEGGEVASQLAIDTIKLQIQALLQEISQEPEIMTPDLVMDQLTAVIRIANNVISSRNDQQGREGRKRMGTTLVMALQLPQLLGSASSNAGNSHEVYIAHVGDSRAYWITSDNCECLTIDHDVTTREVRLGNSTYQYALQNPNSSSLTQALGTKEGDHIKVTLQRFIIDEDGILLLCSDGLSDNNFLEKHWQNFATDMLQQQKPLNQLVHSLLNQANSFNGHDNLSVVVNVYGVSSQPPVLVTLNELVPQKETIEIPSSTSSTSSEIIIQTENIVTSPEEKNGELVADNMMEAEIISEQEVEIESNEKSPLSLWSKIMFVTVGSISLLLLMGVIIIFIQWLVNPQQVEQWRDRIFDSNSSPEEIQ